MAVVIGTNSGFVAAAPVANPSGSNSYNRDYYLTTTKDTSPAGATTITEMGWYCDNATDAANFEVGLYAADGAGVPGEAGTLLESDRTNAKGTTAGWKVVTGLNWSIDSSTAYWLGLQIDNTANGTDLNYNSSGGAGYDLIANKDTLQDPAGGGAPYDADGCVAIYAVYTGGEPGGNVKQINIGDTWKEFVGMQINIGDTWKAVEGMQINIGDTWKEVF